MLLITTPTLRAVYRNLLTHPGDPAIMQVFADVLTDCGMDDLAYAYRWAAERGRWPFVRTERDSNPPWNDTRKVYDWSRQHWGSVPEACRLPVPLYRIIKFKLKEKRYGGVNRAFVLLARGLLWLEQNGPPYPDNHASTPIPS